jgi:hypothetical protein
MRDAVLTRAAITTALSLATLLASCGTRSETEIFVVVVPTGGAGETIGTVVVEARPFGSEPPCASRSSAATTAAVTVDALHEHGDGAYTLGVLTRGEEPTWITVWGKVAGRDRTRRSYLTRAVADEHRVLCVALPLDRSDCQCADPSVAIEILGGAAGIDAAVASCVALVTERGAMPPDGVGEPAACDHFAPSSCEGLALDAGASGTGCGTEPSDAGMDAWTEASDGGSDAPIERPDS